MVRELSRAIRLTIGLWLLTAIIYPLVILGFGQLVVPAQANGSLITNSQGTVVGSALIGQPFASDRYFNSRPSTTQYSTADPQSNQTAILKTGISGASNLAPSNVDLIQRIQNEAAKLKQMGIQPTADLVYTSGSSLDPHITLEAARAQIDRITTARGISDRQIETLILQNVDKRFLGIFGEPGVNVLKLNLALDRISSR